MVTELMRKQFTSGRRNSSLGLGSKSFTKGSKHGRGPIDAFASRVCLVCLHMVQFSLVDKAETSLFPVKAVWQGSKKELTPRQKQASVPCCRNEFRREYE